MQIFQEDMAYHVNSPYLPFFTISNVLPCIIDSFGIAIEVGVWDEPKKDTECFQGHLVFYSGDPEGDYLSQN